MRFTIEASVNRTCLSQCVRVTLFDNSKAPSEEGHIVGIAEAGSRGQAVKALRAAYIQAAGVRVEAGRTLH